jgi:hypothetical protein
VQPISTDDTLAGERYQQRYPVQAFPHLSSFAQQVKQNNVGEVSRQACCFDDFRMMNICRFTFGVRLSGLQSDADNVVAAHQFRCRIESKVHQFCKH